MTTRLEQYLNDLMEAVKAIPGFPARVESSLLRGFTREEPTVLVIRPGDEVLSDDAPYGRAHRHREVQCVAILRGDEPELDAIRLADQFHPVVMAYAAPGLIRIVEVGSDEPISKSTDLRVCFATVRYRIVYETAEHSLSD